MKSTKLYLLSAIIALCLAAGCAPKRVYRVFTPTKVNVGASANDGTGDSLRLAFMKMNTNMVAISNQFVLLQAMVATASNTLASATSGLTNALASTNFVNANNTVVSNTLLAGITAATNSLASTNYVNGLATAVSNSAPVFIGAYSNTVTALLGAKAGTNAPTILNPTLIGATVITNSSSAGVALTVNGQLNMGGQVNLNNNALANGGAVNLSPNGSANAFSFQTTALTPSVARIIPIGSPTLPFNNFYGTGFTASSNALTMAQAAGLITNGGHTVVTISNVLYLVYMTNNTAIFTNLWSH